uniref:Uncharacterized protein n=1 Tax=Aegilops tauschii subsp. strangulata TaxID=200361 RepID=A0A453SFK9_AEGTS
KSLTSPSISLSLRVVGPMSSSAAHQKAAAAAPVEEEAGEHGPFPIEQLQVRSAERPSRLPPPQSIRSFSAAEA